MRNALVFCST